MTFSPPAAGYYGATQDEWAWAAYQFGADLLPAVGDPVFRLSEKSHLQGHTSLAKTPSLTGSNGESFGIRAWTAHRATPDSVRAWASDPQLNVLLITRTVRAIDIDVADEAAAAALEQYITVSLGLTAMPVRYRDGTGKRTLLVKLAPHTHIRKRVIHTAHGAIEFLADGQQTALFGTHPSGARFKLRGHENGIPTVAQEAMAALWDAMRAAYDPKNKKPFIDPDEQAGEFIVRNAGTLAGDPVLQFLEAEGWVVGYMPNGTANIRCPNEAQHSEGSSANATSWLPAGLGGKKEGGFRCLHGHCEHIDTGMFLNLIGFHRKEAEASFTAVAEVNPITALEQQRQQILQSPAPSPAELVLVEMNQYRMAAVSLEQAGIGWLMNKKGTEREPGQANLNHICRGVPDFLRVKYDTFREELLVQTGSSTTWKQANDNVVTNLRESIQRAYGLKYSSSDVSAALHAAGDYHAFDSAKAWLQQQRHDGTPRIPRFATDILGALDSQYATALAYYVWVALAARILEPGVKADMAPIFVSPKQGTGKSSLVRAMAPFDDWYGEFDLATRDEDGSRLLRGKSVIELPELKGLASRDAESIKAWLTRQTENWIPKYKEFAVVYPRRCIFIGTDNRQRFLSDPSGNRRFLPLRVAVLKQYIDWPVLRENCAQYWAEAAAIITAFPSVQEAVEHFSKAVDALAEPARLAATILDENFDEARAFLANQLPGAYVTINALKAQLKMTGTYDNYRAYNILRMLGWEQVDGTNRWERKNISSFTL